MHYQTLRNSVTAYVLRLIPNPFGRYRRRYRFYQRIKNSDLILKRKIRHSGIVLPPNLGEWIQYWMFMDGAYEKQLVDFLKPYVTGKVFFDVGANVGSYTLTLAKSAARTYSFEASSSNASILRNFVNLSKLNSIELINKAVSNQSGRVFQFTHPLIPVGITRNSMTLARAAKRFQQLLWISLLQIIILSMSAL